MSDEEADNSNAEITKVTLFFDTYWGSPDGWVARVHFERHTQEHDDVPIGPATDTVKRSELPTADEAKAKAADELGVDESIIGIEE